MLDTGCWILDFGFCLRTSDFQPYRDSPALGRMLESIVDQVDQGLLERFAVGIRLKVELRTILPLPFGRGEGWGEGSASGFDLGLQLRSLEAGEEELELDAALGGIGLHQLDGLLRQCEQVGRLEVVLLAALLDAGEVQHVLDAW